MIFISSIKKRRDLEKKLDWTYVDVVSVTDVAVVTNVSESCAATARAQMAMGRSAASFILGSVSPGQARHLIYPTVGV